MFPVPFSKTAVSGSALDHFEVDLRDVCADHVSTTTVDDGAVALSLVLILDEPEWGMKVSGLVNTKASIKLGYLINLLLQEESLVFLDLTLRPQNRFIAI